MAASPFDLGALEKERARLEAALGADENWRALTQPATPSASANDDTARRARDMRLEMALTGNPDFRAWKDVTEAIMTLRARAAGDTGPDPSPELPRELVEHIRANAAGGMQDATATRPPVMGRATVPAVAPPARRLQTVADPGEATVTFVTREARTPLLPSAGLAADLDGKRSSGLFERLRRLKDAPAATFVPANPEAGEAAVTIRTPEQIEADRLAEEHAALVRRLYKALSGD